MQALFYIYWQTWRQLRKQRARFLAAALSYQTIFVLSPLLFFVVSLIDLIFTNQQVREYLLDRVNQVYGQTSSEVVKIILENTSQWTNISWLNLIFTGLFIIAWSGFIELIRYSFRQIWEIESTTKTWKHLAKEQILNLVLVLAITTLLFILTSLDTIINNLAPLIPVYFLPTITFNQILFFFLFAILLFSLTKILIPVKIATWPLVYGCLHSSLFFTLGKVALSWYFSRSELLSLYGASSSVVVLLIWVNFSAQTVFFGLALAKVLQEREKSKLTEQS